MTEEQKRFKISKRTSYEKQISTEEKCATLTAFAVGVAAAAAIINISSASQEVETTARLIESGVGYLFSGFGTYNLKLLIEAISRKTVLEGKVEDINTELEMPENEESRGMRR